MSLVETAPPPAEPAENLSEDASRRDQDLDRRGPLRPTALEPSRRRFSGRLVTRIIQITDIVLLGLGAFLAQQSFKDINPSIGTLFVGLIAAPSLLSLMGAYTFSRREGLFRRLLVTVAAMVASTGAIVLGQLIAPNHNALQPILLVWAAYTYAPLVVLHGFWWWLIRHWRMSGRLTPNLIVVGATSAAMRLIDSLLQSREANVLGLFDDRANRSPTSIRGVPVLGGLKDLIGHRILPYADRLVISVPSMAQKRVRELVAQLRVLPNEIVLLLDKEDEDGGHRSQSWIADVPLVHISGPPGNDVRALFKRIQDLTLGLIVLALTWPIMAMTIMAIRLEGPGPIFFRQRRYGFNNEEILVWKFRSMRAETVDQTAQRQVLSGDSRVTRVGQFIRKTSIDELPQIFNVLAGQMSLVGPRPHAIGMLTGNIESARLVAEYAHRHQIKPGMTGWAAVNGSRGPIDTPDLVKRRVALDIAYIERQSFWLDLWIMLSTVPLLLGDTKTVR